MGNEGEPSGGHQRITMRDITDDNLRDILDTAFQSTVDAPDYSMIGETYPKNRSYMNF